MYTDLVHVKLNLKFTEILHGDPLKSLTLHVGAIVLPWLFHKSRIQMIAARMLSIVPQICIYIHGF